MLLHLDQDELGLLRLVLGEGLPKAEVDGEVRGSPPLAVAEVPQLCEAKQGSVLG